jgi:hypothetical protein
VLITMHVPDLADFPVQEFDDTNFLAEMHSRQLWPWGLAMAVRDGAASVHFHPWRTDCTCDFIKSYIVDGRSYGLLIFGWQSERQLFLDSRAMAATNFVAKLCALVTGIAVGRLRLIAESGESDWCVVYWRYGGMQGVDFWRVSDPVAGAMREEDSIERPETVIRAVTET